MPELVWQRPSFVDDTHGEYLEVAVGPEGMVHIRQNTHPDRIVSTTPAKWEAWVKGVKAGEFDHFVD
ncbi:DUF397 domain-containing protein [Streptomyces zingiberis]|uniref:DUF397 domain-containing protein n=1 Tax=Streptomyces zingiberis TaxID=2053010 RepID=A0ABX1BW37_9ACTN|nr:DUF397 domain-containing protein [Streptomyces zingiberis]NJQ00100.1 DUF397 domain-containing protein [Streptomyces zingiberis]